jgi:hypothetical protein
MSEPKDMIVLLREMRKEMNERFDEVNGRLTSLEVGQKSIRHALTADTMMGRLVTGDFESASKRLRSRSRS